MLKKIIPKLALAFFFCNTLCYGQLNRQTSFSSKEDNQLNIRLSGSVKSVSIRSKNLGNKSIDSIFYAFNNNGIITDITTTGQGVDVIARKIRLDEIHHKFEQGKIVSKLNKASNGRDGEIFQYDTNRNLVLQKLYMNNKLIKEIAIKYDRQNRIAEKVEYLYGGFSDYDEQTEKKKSKYLYTIETYTYDAKGNLILKKEKNLRKQFTETTQYKYDTSNNLIEEGNCISDGGNKDCNYKPLFGYKYNSKNQIIKKFDLAEFSPHNTDENYEYDADGNEIDSKGYYIYPDKWTILGYHFKYQYDQFGNKLREEEVVGDYRSLGLEKYKIELTKYDKFQSMTLREYLTPDGSTIKVISKEYSYDNAGNWTTMEISEGKSHDELNLTEIVTRKIEYYQ